MNQALERIVPPLRFLRLGYVDFRAVLLELEVRMRSEVRYHQRLNYMAVVPDSVECPAVALWFFSMIPS